MQSEILRFLAQLCTEYQILLYCFVIFIGIVLGVRQGTKNID